MSANILVVDDSAIVRKVIIRTLGMAAISTNSVHQAGNGAEALEVISNQPVDVIFLDINMPVMDGLAFLERLRANSTTKDLPVIVISTEGSQERIARLNELGITDYLRKPFTPENFAKAIQDALSHHR